MKTVLITGCTPGGIGYAIAREFQSRGLRVLGTARSTEVLRQLEDDGIEAFEFEITSEASIQDLKKHIEERTGGTLDILVNNAGVSHTVPALDLDLDEVRKVFEINLFGLIRITQVFAPLLIKSKGIIVNIGSVAGVVPYVFGSAYNASKAALHAFSDSLRIEVAPFGVRVVVVVTGGVRSNISSQKRRLKEDSLYLPIEENYLNRQGNSQLRAMRTEDYARQVVSDLLKPTPGSWLWRGDRAALVRLLSWLLPWSFWDNFFTRKFGLNRLASARGNH